MHTGTEREERIRQEAYRIWEQEGRPKGREREHWKEAVRRVESGESGPMAANPGEGATPASPSRQRKARTPATKPAGQRKPKSQKH